MRVCGRWDRKDCVNVLQKRFMSLFLSAGLHDEERSQEEELDRALVHAEAKLHLVLRRRRPGGKERGHLTGRKLQCGGKNLLYL